MIIVLVACVTRYSKTATTQDKQLSLKCTSEQNDKSFKSSLFCSQYQNKSQSKILHSKL